MNDLRLKRLFARAAHDSPAPPAADLEERVLAQWRTMDGSKASLATEEMARSLRVALVGACVIMAVTCAVAYPILSTPTDPGVVLTNLAIQTGFSHE